MLCHLNLRLYKQHYFCLFFSCNYDFIEVRDGGTINAPQLGKFCGYDTPSTVFTTGNVMYARFRTDTSVPRPGFKAQYKIGKNIFLNLLKLISVFTAALSYKQSILQSLQGFLCPSQACGWALRCALLRTSVCTSQNFVCATPPTPLYGFVILHVLHELWDFVIFLLYSIKGTNLVCTTPPTSLDGFC